MKIVVKSNFDNESINDRLIAENVGEYYGKAIVKFLNNKFGGNTSPDYFILVKDDYKLYEFEP